MVRVQVCMAECRLMKSIQISRNPLPRLTAISTEYADEYERSLLEDICEVVQQFLLGKDLAEKDDAGNLVVATNVPGGDDEKQSKDKKEKKEKKSEKQETGDSKKEKEKKDRTHAF